MRVPSFWAWNPHSKHPCAMERRFEEYVSELGAVVGNEARRRGLEDYVGGLLLPGGRKSMEPIAERLDPDNVSRRHQQSSTSSPRRAGATPPCASGSAPGDPGAAGARAIEHLIIDDTTCPRAAGTRSASRCSMRAHPRHRQLPDPGQPVAVQRSRQPAGGLRALLPESWAHDRKRRLHAACPRRCASGPSPRSRSTSCAGRSPPACPAGSC